MNDLSGFLLNKIQKIAPPSEEGMRRKFEVHKQSLIKSAYSFITFCKSEAKKCMERAVNRMVFQLLSVQNGAYFKLKLYRIGRIPLTTAIRIGLFQRIADYMNTCSDYLREGDLQCIVREIALRLCRHFKEVLIGYSLKPPRVFNTEHDTKYIVGDYNECNKLFSDFGLFVNDDEKKENVFSSYSECIQMMQCSTKELIQKHMIKMMERKSEQNKNKNIQKVKSLHTSIRAKAVMDKAVIGQIYDDQIIHVLAHRSDDDEAVSYVENFVQYRHSQKPLIIDLSQTNNTLRIIIHEGVMKKQCNPFCRVSVVTQSERMKNETRIIRQTAAPKWDEAIDCNLKNIKKMKGHIMIEIDCWHWKYDGSDQLIGKITERLECGQQNVCEEWMNLDDDENGKKGKILISIECENLWNQ